MDTLFGFFARKTDLYVSPNVEKKPEELILKSFRKWEKVALEKHKRDKAERDEVSEFESNFIGIQHSFLQADRVRRDKLRRKREEEEAEKNESSKIVEVTDEEAEKITRENAQAKVNRRIIRLRESSIVYLGAKNRSGGTNSSCS